MTIKWLHLWQFSPRCTLPGLARSSAGSIGTLAVIFSFLASSQPTDAQEQSDAVSALQVGSDLDDTTRFQELGPGKCSLCHTRKDKVSEYLSTAFCALDEYSIWEEHDIHSRSFRILTQEGGLGVKIAKRLGWQPEDLSRRRECLSCHVGLQSTTQPTLDEQPDQSVPFATAGVSCEACHGPSSRWIDAHWKTTDWRKIPPQRKLDEFGFTELRRPSTKARLCFSCHVGDAKLGRVVTHAMYAAGHPPLPSIELATFEQAMPAHWRSTREKPNFQFRSEFIRENYSGQSETDHLGDLPRLRTTLISGLVAYQQSLRLLADTAQLAQSKSRMIPQWPELGVFDCQACHHDLRSPSVRIDFGYADRIPGRPTPLVWPSAVIQSTLSLTSDPGKFRSELHSRNAGLVDALNARPFGDPSELRQVIVGADIDRASKIDSWLEQCIRDLEQIRFDRSQAEELVLDLCALPPNAYPDYHSARQIAWTIQTVLIELDHKYPSYNAREPIPDPESSTGSAASAAKVNEDLDRFRVDRERIDAAREQSHHNWSPVIRTRLATQVPQTNTLSEKLAEELSALRDYDPYRFQALLRSIAAARRTQTELHR